MAFLHWNNSCVSISSTSLTGIRIFIYIDEKVVTQTVAPECIMEQLEGKTTEAGEMVSVVDTGEDNVTALESDAMFRVPLTQKALDADIEALAEKLKELWMTARPGQWYLYWFMYINMYN